MGQHRLDVNSNRPQFRPFQAQELDRVFAEPHPYTPSFYPYRDLPPSYYRAQHEAEMREAREASRQPATITLRARFKDVGIALVTVGMASVVLVGGQWIDVGVNSLRPHEQPVVTAPAETVQSIHS